MFPTDGARLSARRWASRNIENGSMGGVVYRGAGIARTGSGTGAAITTESDELYAALSSLLMPAVGSRPLMALTVACIRRASCRLFMMACTRLVWTLWISSRSFSISSV
jgi:hypothetical protein